MESNSIKWMISIIWCCSAYSRYMISLFSCWEMYIYILKIPISFATNKKIYMNQGGSDPIIMNLRPWRSFKPSMVIDYSIYWLIIIKPIWKMGWSCISYCVWSFHVGVVSTPCRTYPSTCIKSDGKLIIRLNKFL